MNGLGFNALHFSWLFLLLIPLILFYFLKLKRPQQQIASLVLWQQVLDDQRVNSPFQRFKRNLLLLLQLLLLLILILAALQPFTTGGAERADYMPILIDTSASMSATDEKTKTSRLDVAKEKVTELINSMLPDQRIALVAIDSTARRLTEFTNDKRLLRDALNQLETTDSPTQLEEGFRMIQAMARLSPVEEVLLFSDGNFPQEISFELPFAINYQQIPAADTNLAITSFNAQRTSENGWTIFARIEAAQGSNSAELILLQDGKEVDSGSIIVGVETPYRYGITLEVDELSQLELQLVPKQHDAIKSDNQAFLTIPETRPLRVYVDPDLTSYRHAMASLENIEVYPQPGTDPEAVAGEFDLLITKAAPTSTRSAQIELYDGQIPEKLSASIQSKENVATVIDWYRNAPLLEHVLLQDLVINTEPVFQEGIKETDLQEQGFEILVHGQSGPLILQENTFEHLRYYTLFGTDQSTLPFRIGFPIMVSNLVQQAMQTAGLSETHAAKTGVLPELKVNKSAEFSVSGPRDLTRKLNSDEQGRLAGIPAPYVGNYEIHEGGSLVTKRGASLLNQSESSLVSHDHIQFDELAISAAEELIDSVRPWWRALTILAFLVLLVEWWYFQRRPGGVSV